MRAGDVIEHFLSHAHWVDRETTVDRVIRGNPDADVDRCLVSWIASFASLRQMVARGVPMLITHEPIFWRHRPDRPGDDPAGREKFRFIQEHDLVILRNHDCWDIWPEVGIPWAWARFLGLGPKPAATAANGFQHRYDIEPVRLEGFARRVAGRCASLGEPFVQVTGKGAQEVSRIGIGTGCACDIPTYRQMGCDCSIVCDDGTQYYSDIQRAEDMGHPVIRVSHGTAEEPGMMALAEYINANIRGLQAEHLPHGSTFRLVGAGEGESATA